MDRISSGFYGVSEGRFETTRWSVVLKAGKTSSASARGALESLCGDYWYPLYAYVRRRGYSIHEAQDLTQEFFSQFIQKDYVARADHERGRFRTFLLSALDHFLANQWDKKNTIKRGGRCQVVSWDELQAEERYRQESTHDLTAERLYERQWALTLLRKASDALSREFASAKQSRTFEVLQQFLSGHGEESYQAVAAQLGITEAAVKTRVRRLRRRFGQLLRAEIAQTVSSTEEVEEELKHLYTLWD